MNALDLLKNDHRRILKLAQGVETIMDNESAHASHEARHHLARAIRFHERMLDEVFYPELERHSEARSIISKQSDKHQLIKDLLKDFGGTEFAESDSLRRLTSIKEAWLSHIEQSESQLLPVAEKLLDAGRLLEMSYEMEEIRTQQSDQDSAIYPARRLSPNV